MDDIVYAKQKGRLPRCMMFIGFIFLMGCTNSNSVETVEVNIDREQKVLPKPEQSISQRLPRQCGFETLYYGKVKYHKVSKTYYLTVKDRVIQNSSEEFALDQVTSPEISDKYILLYGNQLVGGKRAVMEGEVLQVVDNNKIYFDKLRAWCVLQPNSSSEPKAPVYREFKYREARYELQE